MNHSRQRRLIHPDRHRMLTLFILIVKFLKILGGLEEVRSLEVYQNRFIMQKMLDCQLEIINMPWN